MTPNKKLEGLEKITELLKIIFASGNIDEKPLSCMLVAPVSSGKTISIKQFKKNKNILITTDSTAYGVLKNYQNMLKNSEIRHIIIPDLLNALARKKTTADQLILFINASSEDGLFPSHTYGMDINQFIDPFGWVLCITKDGYEKKEKFFKEIGFISRFLIVEYNYSQAQISKILENVINEINIEIPDIKLKGGRIRKHIEGNIEIFKELVYYSRLLCRESESEVIRMQKKLQTFLKSSAYLRGDNQVTKEDLDKLKDLINLIK
jgi:hypothetical protein